MATPRPKKRINSFLQRRPGRTPTRPVTRGKTSSNRPRPRVPPQPPRETGGDRWTRRHNQTVGRGTGRVLEPVDRSPAARQQRQTQSRGGRRYRSSSIALGTSKLPAKTQRQHDVWFGNSSGLSSETQMESNLNNVYDQLTGDFRERQQETAAISNEYYQGHMPEAPEPGGWAGVTKDVLDVASVLPGVPTAEKFEGSPLGRILDIVGRPSYGLFEGIRNTVEGLGEKPDESDKSILSSLPDIFKGPLNDAASSFLAGASRGLMGQEKSGPGQVYETAKENPNWAGGATLREFERNHPQVEQRVAQGVGLAGEIFNPTDKLGITKTATHTGPLSRFGQVTEDSVAAATRHTVASAVDEYYDNVYFPKSGNLPRPRPREAFVDAGVVNALDRLSVAGLSVRRGGAPRYKVMNPRLWGNTVSQSVVESTRQVVLKTFNNHMAIFWRRNGTNNPLSANAVQNMMALDPDFSQYIDDVADNLAAANKVQPNAPLDEVLFALSKEGKDGKHTGPVEQAIRNAYDADLQKVGDDVYSMTRNASYQTLGIKVGKKVIPVKATGRAYNKIAELVPDTVTAKFDQLSYEKLFPSILSLRAQRARSVGADAFKNFKKEIQAIGKKYTPDQAKEIHYAIQNNIDLSGDAHLQAGKQAVMDAYARMWKEEIAAGTRPSGDVLAPNYVFIYNRKGFLDARTEFKAGRKDAIQRGLPNAGNYNMERAVRDGLKPVDNAFEAVMYRYLKSQRDITRALYRTDLIENYGFRTHKIGDIAVGARNIKKIEYDTLPQHLRTEVDLQGGHYYLPKEHYDSSELFNKLSSWSSAEMGAFVRWWNKVLGSWKFLQTIPNPGFHVTNMVGDTFMGFMDGVRPDEYFNLLRKVAQSKAGRAANYKIAPGFEMSVSTLWTMYQKDAAGGYFHIDTGNYVKPSTKNVAGRVGRTVRDVAVDMSEMREDFGRFAHYIHAFREEARAAYKKGERSNYKLMNAARDSALWRVNHYRFDYNALTLWERQLKTTAIPFYTYTRKILPILVESLFQNPKYLRMVNRFMMDNDGSAADAFSNWDVPEYLRMGGGAFLNSNEEPLFASLSALPMGNLNMLQPGGTMNPADPNFWTGQGSIANTMARYSAPPIQMPFELTAGEEAFSGSQINDVSDYFMNKIPMVKDIREEGNEVPGLNRVIPGQDEEFNPQAMIYNRLFGAGQQVRPVTYGQQAQARNQWVDELIEDPISNINTSQSMFTVSKSNRPSPEGKMTFRVLSRMQLGENGEPGLIQEFNTAKEAIDFVRSVLPPGYRKPEEYMSNQLDPNTGLPRQITRD